MPSALTQGVGNEASDAGNVDEAWVDARTQMDSHCGAGQWKVMKEEKVQTGTYATNWGYGITTAQPIQGTAVTYVCTR
jgi:hypothetical protein